MLDALRTRLQIEFNVSKDIWTIHKVPGKGARPSNMLSEEQIVFVTQLINEQFLSANMITQLFGYPNGSARFKALMDKYGIDYSSKKVKELQSTTRKNLREEFGQDETKSKGHLWITKFCDEQGWTYIEEWSGTAQNKCINPKTNRELRFDIYVPHLELLIEYQGRQHTHIDHTYHKRTASKMNITYEEAYELYQKRDAIKVQWAKKHGYQYVAVPYTLYDHNYPLTTIFSPYIK